MNCDDFGQQLNDRLDDRLPIDCGELRDHARECASCQAQMDAWQQISSILPAGSVAVSRSDSSRRYAGGRAFAIAAVLLVAFTIHWKTDLGQAFSQSGSVPSQVDRGDEATVLAQAGDLDPIGWWREVQDRDWINQTMPTVKSVQQGVAPIGRSLMRAATILTIGGPNQTS
ncbi:MAG: anti-sigma factor [Rubripirellula sp.]